jgi:hypothetical protein
VQARKTAALAFAAALTAAPPALADGFWTHDLGAAGTPEACLDRASRAMETYFRQNGVTDGLVQVADWSVQGYDLPPGDVQAQFVCPYRDGVVEIALLFTYSAGPESDRHAVVESLTAIWDRLGAPVPLTK